MNKYAFYGCDTETTGLDFTKNDIIELSIYRLSDDVQKTWFIKPFNIENIEAAALRINGHKIEDLKGETKYGRDTYLDANKAIIEIENWLAEDSKQVADRCLIGHNINFDKNMLEQLWIKCLSTDSFPFGRRALDTMQIELMMDYVADNFAEGYSLSNLSKKYNVKNEKAHSASADIKCTIEIFKKQAMLLKNNA
jgi:DNA polymerase III alpha subunit (gram-positive type)